MNKKPQQSKRSGRSNAYSESKCSNWMPFDPYQGEIATIPKNLTPNLVFSFGDNGACNIYERPVHSAFMRPIDAGDVAQVLQNIPNEYLVGLNSIYLEHFKF